MSEHTTNELNAKRQLEFPTKATDADIPDKVVEGDGSAAMVTDETAAPTETLETSRRMTERNAQRRMELTPLHSDRRVPWRSLSVRNENLISELSGSGE
jgi:hypothetical protein